MARKNQSCTNVSVVLLVVMCAHVTDEACPSSVYCGGTLLDVVQRSGLYPDSKTFVDMPMTMDPEDVIRDFDLLMKKGHPDRHQLKTFLSQHFEKPGGELESWIPEDWSEMPPLLEKIKDQSMRMFAKDLNGLWKILGRKIKELEHPERHSILPLPNPFIVPGDRFREFYYWDTYWIIGGLLAVNMTDTARGMLQNLIHLVHRYGFVPNGGRIYYTGRSQPSLLTPMIDLYIQHTSDTKFLEDNIGNLDREHNFWLGERSLNVQGRSGQDHSVARYYVEMNGPRPEGYMTDVELTSNMTEKDAKATISHLASACESGWDFSSRWFGKEMELSSIKTQAVIPVDLNVYLCWTEHLLAKFHKILGDTEKEQEYLRYAEARRAAIDDLFWDEDKNLWFDFDLESRQKRNGIFPSNVFPLLANCTNIDFNRYDHSEKILNSLERSDLFGWAGGVPTSTVQTGQQWDFPNAWSPLVHFMIESISSLPSRHAHDVARNIAETWLKSNHKGWKKSGYMYEKYDVQEFGKAGGGGEYDVQVGFGWTNGVILMLLEKYNDITVGDDSEETGVSNEDHVSVYHTIFNTYPFINLAHMPFSYDIRFDYVIMAIIIIVLALFVRYAILSMRKLEKRMILKAYYRNNSITKEFPKSQTTYEPQTT